MKQYITKQDLEQLSGKGKERLREWWKPETSNLVTYIDKDLIKWVGVYGNEVELNKQGYLKRNLYPLLSIGQMVEFLDEHSILWWDENGCKVLPWNQGEELCDSLWFAVKEVLETEGKE